MPNWDIFHSDRLEVERNLPLEAIRAAVRNGEIVGDDLARVAGSGQAWVRLTENTSLWAEFSGQGTAPPSGGDSRSLRDLMEDDDDGSEALDEFDEEDEPSPKPTLPERSKNVGMPHLPASGRKATTEDLDPIAMPDNYSRDYDLNLRDAENVVVLDLDDEEPEYDPEAEDEEAAGFTFTRAGAETVEELDLAAMVDVAFQLVLFFLVTASTVIFKTLEVPAPKPEEKKGAATQTIGKTMAEIEESRILVEVDSNGEIKIDHSKAPNDFAGLAEILREVRKKTDRNGILLTAESATAHKNAVKVYDAAAEVGLSIAVAQPKPAPEKAPAPPPEPK